MLFGQSGHPANYKGCEIYQKKLKAQQPKRMTVVQRLQQKSCKQNEPIKQVTSEVSYAQIVKTSSDKQSQETTYEIATNEPTISDMMKMLSEFQNEMRKNFSQLGTRVGQLEKNSEPLLTKRSKNKNKNDK